MRSRAKIATFLFVVLAAGSLILWNTSAQDAPSSVGVTEAKRNAALHLGQELSVRGTVLEGSLVESESGERTFVVADAFEQLRIVYRGVLPENFGVKEVVVRGVLAEDALGTVLLEGTAIQVGCSSKY